MKKLFVVFSLIVSCFVGAGYSQYCSKINGSVEIVNIPRGQARLKLEQFEPSYQIIQVYPDESTGYYEVAPPNGGTWYLKPYWVMQSGYDETAGSWTLSFDGPAGPVIVNNQATFIYSSGCVNTNPNELWPFHFQTKFRASEFTCQSKSISGRVVNHNTGQPESGVYVHADIFSSTHNGVWTLDGQGMTSTFGYYVWNIGNSTPLVPRCGRWRLMPQNGSYTPSERIVDVFESSDSETGVYDFYKF